jgi:ATP-dependent helicase HrpB
MNRLPIDEVLPRLRDTLARHAGVVLQAPPGAGKTTHVPLALLDEPWLTGKSILILEPRRLAARAAAGRMAQLRGEAVGETVGYRIRFDTKVSARTRIEVLTEGILTRRIQNDQSLDGVGLVIFDEFHERHLHADLALALTLDCQRNLRDDLKLLVMSATLDAAAVSKLLGDAPLVTSEGRSYPVDVRYVPSANDARIAEAVGAAVVDALDKEAGDVLAFLPGAWEIRKAQEQIQARAGSSVDVMPLYGDLPWEQQDKAIRPSVAGRRKVVLATPIAETSLTIDGVRVVVDSGFARVPQFDPASGLTRLTSQRISRASSEQRAGRAGRTAPGICIRLWGETVQRGLIPQSIPEIRSADLAPLALELAAWGVSDATQLAWLDAPPPAALAQARELLQRLGALDVAGGITPTGREMAKLPLHPRLSHMLYEAQRLGAAALACDIAALLSERDVFTGDARRNGDFALRLDALRAFRRQGRTGTQAHGADANGCQRVDRAAGQYRRLLRVDSADSDSSLAGVLLAFAYPDRVGLARAAGSHRYLLASGRGARLPEGEMRRPACIVAASMDAGEGEGLIYLAAALDVDDIERHLGAQLQVREIVRWDDAERAVAARREERFGALVLDSKALTKPDTEAVRAAMLEGVRRTGIACLPWTPAVREWQARVNSLRSWCQDENWPDVSDAALEAMLGEWLGPYLDGISRLSHLTRLDVLEILKARLDWKQQQRLDEGAPTHLEVPSGSHVRLAYEPGQAPVLAVKLQEMFGLADTPRVAWGRVPVTLHLLSPGRQPIQVTQDLRGFWERTYTEVKKELKGRYPKHPWPDDPWSARPTARAKSRPR